MTSYEFYSLLFMISVVIAVLGLIGAIASFFMFDIKTIYAIRSGKEQRKSMKESQQQYAATGGLRQNYDFDYDTQTLGKKNRSTRFRTKGAKSQKLNGTASGKLPSAQLAPAAAAPPTVGMSEPAQNPVQAPAQIAETTVLEEQPAGTVHTNDGVIARAPVSTPGFKFVLIEDTVVTHTDEVVF